MAAGRGLPGGGCRSGRPLEPDEPVRPALLDVVADGLEAGLREGAERAVVAHVDAGDAGEDGGVGEHAPARVRALPAGPEPAPAGCGRAELEGDAGDARADPDELLPLRVVGHDVALD